MNNQQENKVLDKVPLKTRIGWGMGGLADNYIMNVFMTLVTPVYVISLGMDPVLLGWAICIPRFSDALFDVWIGNISDNSRTRWGRRRPYIFVGAVLSALILPFLWLPPVRTDMAMFIYLLIMGLVYLLIYSVYVVPYTALGYELTSDYNERTRVLAWRMYIGLIGNITIPGLYWLCLKVRDILTHLPQYAEQTSFLHSLLIKIQQHPGSDSSAAAFWLSIAMGGIIFVCGILPAVVCREKSRTLHQEKIQIWSAIRYTLRNRPFMILSIVYIIVIFGLFTPATLGLCVNVYYVFGNEEGAAFLQMLSGPMAAGTSYLSMFLISWISVRWDKRFAMMTGLILTLLGVSSAWITLTPKMPYLQLVSSFISLLGLQGCWLMISSMVADVCDEDELKTGLRREGVYGAVNGLALKASLSLTAVAGGSLLKFSGYDSKIAEAAGSVPLDVALRMKTLMIGVQMVMLIIAMIILLFYPITRKRAEQTRRILDQKYQDTLNASFR